MTPTKEMNGKQVLAAIVLIGCVGSNFGCRRVAFASHHSGAKGDSASFTKTIAGYNVRLVAVEDATVSGEQRIADHSWTPDGFPYDGADARLSARGMIPQSGSGSPVCLAFEISAPKAGIQHQKEMPPTANIDVFAFLPNNNNQDEDGDREGNAGAAGPLPISIWHGIARDSSNTAILPAPSAASLGFRLQSTDPQPVEFGIAQGEYKVIAKGSASVGSIAENQKAVVASGPWGRLEVTHLPRPWAESKPSPTHRFRLLGGVFPPKSERKALFYNSQGDVVATCGDRASGSGYAYSFFLKQHGIADISRFEIQERPYEFATFEAVSFEPPHISAHTGSQGLDHAVDSRLGKVIGLIKPTKDGAWSGSLLYAADGTRWIDPGMQLAGYEYGQFDPWNHPLVEQWSILFEPVHEFSTASTPVTCEVYASDTPTGPKLETLTGWNEMPFRMPMTMISCKPTKHPYVQMHIRAGEGTWRTLESIVVSDHMFAAAEKGAPGTRVLEVFLDDTGSIRIWRDEQTPVTSKSTWHPGEQRIRAIAHLRDGRIAEVDFNTSGYSGTPPHEQRTRGFEFTRQLNGTHVQSGFKSIDLKDILSFEIQQQDLKVPVVISLHAPVN